MRKLAIAASLLALTLPAQANPTLEGVASGLYELEKTHAFLTWTVQHNGISGYTVNFTDFDADLVFDAETPANSQLSVSINPTALNTNYPDPDKKVEWETELGTDARFLNAGEFPTITFNSTSVEQTGEFEGTVTGDLTFLGVTQPVTLVVSYGGVANPPWFGQRDVIGFTASTTINRSEFGNTSLGGVISDEVVIEFSGEFLQAEE
ncbi:MAG: YceI family protein [Hyphomonadaceae bacterium]|nr:YceI family protein [Hyphomonadaceae bacterium]